MKVPMPILMPSIYPIPKPQEYKLHLACWNGEEQPLDVFVKSRAEWDGWNRWRNKRDDFSRPYILALIDFYPQADRWLFGGAYRVLARRPVQNAFSYDVELLPESQPFVGRLKLILRRPGRTKAFNLENQYEKIIVDELLPEPFNGQSFSGYDAIDLPFVSLEAIVHAQRPDWKAALENAKGVYLITDTSNGKVYVGSAYGDSGLWSRWECYAGTGHGHNDELTRLIRSYGIDYARKHFKFALLEQCPSKMDDKSIIRREGFWKSLFSSRGQLGYNKN